ncbi:SET and MYND domain-containing protein 3 [Coelomomyces lativittatus]|nr:SET and MYND domain-containing protein 3 [Coelomomyces lativittatus]
MFDPLKLKTNGFSVTNYTLGIYPCAQGVYLGSSLVNHACDPNAIVLFEGRQLVLKCLRPIQVGDEIVISYCDPCLSRKARQRQLLETYHFLCTCTRCEVEKKMEDEEISSNNLHSKRKKDQNDEDLPQLHELSLEALTQLERSFSSPHDAHLQSIRLDTLYALKRPGQSVENPALLSLAQRIHATYVHHLKPWHPFSIVAELDVLELRYLWYVNSSSSLPPPCSLSQLKQHFQEWIQIAKVWFNDQQLLQWKVENLQYGIFKYLS